jgi:hypothetical protein
MKKAFFIILIISFFSCKMKTATEQMEFNKGTFGYDLNFLKKLHKDIVVLSDDSVGAHVIILPGYQGRVMTSTAEGLSGQSFGWLNHELIASGKSTPHFSAFGGEERFWLGPEGGQFSIYFGKGKDFIFDNWFVPKEIDTEPFELVSSDKSKATFQKTMHLENYTGTIFDLKVDRMISLLTKNQIENYVGSIPSGIKFVGFESENTLTNTGSKNWDKQTGLLSIWILSMLNADDSTTIIIPLKKTDSLQNNKTLTDDYFGKVPSDRLKKDDGLILFKADGNYRSKIGISPDGALPIAGSYDSKNDVLTIAQFSLPEGATDYVNSLWKMQEDPLSGDAVNAYNDGPIDGKQMGKFYELESSSPAASLASGQQITHVHRTMHFKGSKEELNELALRLFGKSLAELSLK